MLILIIDTLLISSVFFLMNFVQSLLYSDITINLTEIVTQNKDVIESKLTLELGNLEMIATQLSEKLSKTEASDPKILKNQFLNYSVNLSDSSLFCASPDGEAIYSKGQTINIKGRNYFRLAMEGTPNISERTISRMDGEDIFVISVPIFSYDLIIGTLQKQYTPQEMYNICSLSLFSEQGYMQIINSDGYILISSQQELYNRESDNYYRILYLNNPTATKTMEQNIRDKKSGFIETETHGQIIFSAYTPIEKVYDWYLISSIAKNAVSPNAEIVIRLFYCVLLSVALIFGFSMLYFLHLKRRQQEKLEKLAFFDPVTKGNTYTKFTYDLQKTLSEGNDNIFSIFSFDIDNFKYINSYYGFDTGDKILMQISQLYEKRLKSREQIARVSADHFVILLEDASEKRLKELFQPEISVDGIGVSLSAGLYPITDSTESINLMLDKANLAVQKIKGKRYKQVEIYSKEFDQQMIHNEQLKRSIELALENGEIIPFFQPKININTQKLYGAEALARWKTKEGKLISPGEFIPVCENTGLIVHVDMVIFEQTLRFLRKCLDKGISCVPISVNFSRIHFLNKEFLQKLLTKIEEYKVPPHLIELEVTETAIYDDYDWLNGFFEEIHKAGIQISMDDFGSGYSSLHMLKNVNIDILKIDRGFLSETENSKKQRTIFGSIIQMAHNLEIQVVVEGVENTANIALMKEFNCSIAQGFYFSKPLEQAAFEKIFEKGSL